ncbi:EAL domain-containing protein [Siccibacter colletis]|uniref:EAL domain-containing protein n=1 Tax=Siccibacter colletis TaxID=1505757 RepID=UPI003CF0A5D8
MTNRRLRSLVTAILILAVLLPIALSIWFARSHANEQFNDELETYTASARARVEMVIEQAREALLVLNTLQTTPCSPEHLLAMRRLAYTHRYVQEVIWMDGLSPRCSSLESSSRQQPFPPPDAVTEKGFRAWYTSRTDLDMSYEMVAIGLDRYAVIIDPLTFIDVVPFSSNPINLALIGTASNHIIASTSTLSPDIWQTVREEHSISLTRHGNRYEILPLLNTKLMIVAWASLAPLEKAWRDQLLLWMPFGIVISLLAAAFILRLLGRLQSPRYRLIDALNNRDLTINYQPVVELKSGRAIGAEALVRWPQPDGTWLSPDVFIPMAEQTGTINQLSAYVIERVFEEMSDWLRQHPDKHIAINLAAQDLSSTVLLERLTRLCTGAGVATRQIVIEMTERSVVDPDITGPILTRYRQAGFRVSIDDFGTGYSSLSYLQELEVDILKIDKSFVMALERKQVTSHIIEIARTLKLEMVAEGVENPQQEAWLCRHGVQYGQGWHYSKALPAQAFMRWADDNLASREDETLLAPPHA